MSGVVGVVGKTGVNQVIYDALIVLQHRGQDAAGIMTSDTKRLYLRKANGLVSDVFQQKHMLRLKGNMGIGHVRYPTAASPSAAESQPFFVNSPFGISLVHSGNLTNAVELKAELFAKDRRHVNTGSDAEVMLNTFAAALCPDSTQDLNADSVFQAVHSVFNRCKGAYSAVAMISGQGLVAFRDPYGISPLVFGVHETAEGPEYMVASESAALNVLNFKLIRDIQPGEAVYVTAEGELFTRELIPTATKNPCIFEFVYIARPESVIDGISVHKSRARMGEKLAERIREEWAHLDIDVVMPVPDTSRTMAIPLAYELGVKYREGFNKNRYVGRTFIMPGQAQRAKAVRRKLNTIEFEFRGKNVLLVDDSIVRGTTCKGIIQMARDAGAKNVYFASASPEVLFPSVYGIDMPSRDELIAHKRSLEEIRVALGVDALIYQKLDDLIAACHEGNPEVQSFECSVFTGNYITGDITEEYLQTMERLRSENISIVDDSSEEHMEVQNH